MHGVIAQLKQLGKVRTSETYTTTLNSFMAFRDEQDVPLDGINSDMMLMYEAYLKARGVRMNTISFYMRNLRAVYNRAVEKGLTPQNNPFASNPHQRHQGIEGGGLVDETIIGLRP